MILHTKFISKCQDGSKNDVACHFRFLWRHKTWNIIRSFNSHTAESRRTEKQINEKSQTKISQ